MIGRLKNAEVDLARVKIVVHFYVNEIVDEIDHYHYLLGIEWDFDDSIVINLRKKLKTF